ncbi:LADA_0C11980g1_1 [Lachancea dasiensis]|uniref:Phosphomannomutase n=1 Tax=Lachancea dasiensis TaxID=1072105 RepID=A0A1G4J281_9SACH|nr:LADA_0C11980g1_1 [Lachancea dasiensis]
MTAPEFSYKVKPDTLVLFDVDGTLTPARLTVSEEVRETLKQLRKKVVIGFVGGSDLSKQLEQLGPNVLNDFDYAFSENGLTAYRMGEKLASQSFINWIGEEEYNKLATFILKYLASIELPKRRGTFLEFRNGMINVSPIGRNASNAERNEFEQYDKQHQIRAKFVEALKKEFAHLKLTFSIGGQISFDVFPTGWDKTYCLQHVECDNFKEIHFFGDKTMQGGNDYEIYTDSRTVGHSVQTPDDTVKILRELFQL